MFTDTKALLRFVWDATNHQPPGGTPVIYAPRWRRANPADAWTWFRTGFHFRKRRVAEARRLATLSCCGNQVASGDSPLTRFGARALRATSRKRIGLAALSGAKPVLRLARQHGRSRNCATQTGAPGG